MCIVIIALVVLLGIYCSTLPTPPTPTEAYLASIGYSTALPWWFVVAFLAIGFVVAYVRSRKD